MRLDYQVYRKNWSSSRFTSSFCLEMKQLSKHFSVYLVNLTKTCSMCLKVNNMQQVIDVVCVSNMYQMYQSNCSLTSLYKANMCINLNVSIVEQLELWCLFFKMKSAVAIMMPSAHSDCAFSKALSRSYSVKGNSSEAKARQNSSRSTSHLAP